jgi:hypothetical protein
MEDVGTPVGWLIETSISVPFGRLALALFTRTAEKDDSTMVTAKIE